LPNIIASLLTYDLRPGLILNSISLFLFLCWGKGTVIARLESLPSSECEWAIDHWNWT